GAPETLRHHFPQSSWYEPFGMAQVVSRQGRLDSARVATLGAILKVHDNRNHDYDCADRKHRPDKREGFEAHSRKLPSVTRAHTCIPPPITTQAAANVRARPGETGRAANPISIAATGAKAPAAINPVANVLNHVAV